MADSDSTADATLAQVSPPELSLLVVSATETKVVPLPRQGRLTIGRGDATDIQIDDTLASREHAEIEVQDRLFVTDLGSKNGTTLAGRALVQHQKTELFPGQSIEIGSTLIVVQRTRRPPRPARTVSHPYFEGRVEDAQEKGRPFALARIHLADPDDAPALVAKARRLLGPDDILALWAPGELELLLLGPASKDPGGWLAGAVEGLQARTGFARFPEDGTALDALLARASDLLWQSSASETLPVIADAVMIELHRVAEKVARGNISVLLLGETGAGKEVLAEAIHRASPRHKAPFQRINCAAITETLFEAELFGHEAGAFTGAARARAGLLEAATLGTVFLDEIGELPAASQAKLLRAIEQRQITRLGSTEPRSIDVRFVAATNRDLESGVKGGTFREDLYYRLNGMTITIPPLRDRRLQIPSLAETFLAQAAADNGVAVPKLTPQALRLLERHDWPGNVRELRNVVERALLLAGGGPVEVAHLPGLAQAPAAESAASPASAPLKGELAELERKRILEALEQSAGNQSRAAELLGVSRRTLLNRLDAYNVARPRKPAPKPGR